MKQRIWLVVLGACWFGCHGGNHADPDAAAVDATPDAAKPLGDIKDELAAIPGMTVEEQTTMLQGYRFFVLTYQQPADHHAPDGAKFPQRMTLLHRDYGAPIVVHNSGYNVSTR